MKFETIREAKTIIRRTLATASNENLIKGLTAAREGKMPYLGVATQFDEYPIGEGISTDELTKKLRDECGCFAERFVGTAESDELDSHLENEESQAYFALGRFKPYLRDLDFENEMEYIRLTDERRQRIVVAMIKAEIRRRLRSSFSNRLDFVEVILKNNVEEDVRQALHQ